MASLEKVSPELASVEMLDEAGAPRPLRAAWSQRTAVLAFLRHFG